MENKRGFLSSSFPNSLFQVCEEMGIESPIPVSVKAGDLNNLFSRILRAAEHPHISIPETETGRKHKQFRHLVNNSLMFFSGMFFVSQRLLQLVSPSLYTLSTASVHKY